MGLNTVSNNAHVSCLTLISHLSAEDCPELLCIGTLGVYPFFNSLHQARPAAHVLLCLDVGGQVRCLHARINKLVRLLLSRRETWLTAVVLFVHGKHNKMSKQHKDKEWGGENKCLLESV